MALYKAPPASTCLPAAERDRLGDFGFDNLKNVAGVLKVLDLEEDYYGLTHLLTHLEDKFKITSAKRVVVKLDLWPKLVISCRSGRYLTENAHELYATVTPDNQGYPCLKKMMLDGLGKLYEKKLRHACQLQAIKRKMCWMEGILHGDLRDLETPEV